MSRGKGRWEGRREKTRKEQEKGEKTRKEQEKREREIEGTVREKKETAPMYRSF